MSELVQKQCVFLATQRHRNYNVLPETGYLKRIRGFVDFHHVNAMPGQQNMS
jgi:hypothetical protein